MEEDDKIGNLGPPKSSAEFKGGFWDLWLILSYAHCFFVYLLGLSGGRGTSLS